MKILLPTLLVILLLGLSHIKEPGDQECRLLKGMDRLASTYAQKPGETASFPTKVFTANEWEEMTRNDEVRKFVEQVNAAALSKDYWKDDFRRAFYDSFQEQYAEYLTKRFNQGKPFSVSTGK